MLEAHLPSGDLVETLTAVKAASPTTKVLVLSGDAHPKTTAVVMASGADGVLAKAESSRQIATAIRKLAAGEQTMVMAPQLALASCDPIVEARVRTLTRREWEILGLLAAGWSNRRIAEDYLLSISTVRTHVQHVLVKLGVHSKLGAVAFAVEHGGGDCWQLRSPGPRWRLATPAVRPPNGWNAGHRSPGSDPQLPHAKAYCVAGASQIARRPSMEDILSGHLARARGAAGGF